LLTAAVSTSEHSARLYHFSVVPAERVEQTTDSYQRSCYLHIHNSSVVIIIKTSINPNDSTAILKAWLTSD